MKKLMEHNMNKKRENVKNYLYDACNVPGASIRA